MINVGKDLTTSGPTASEIMNNIPTVNVDPQTGDIALERQKQAHDKYGYVQAHDRFGHLQTTT